MVRNLLIIILAFGLAMCADEENEKQCETQATIRDLSGLDGCGWVFELEDGTRLEPLKVFLCGTPPVTNVPNDVLINYNFVDGKKVLIDYKEANSPSICMVGPTVIITCIRDAQMITQD